MEPAVIATTAILLTLVVGLVVQTAVSYVKKAKKSKKPAKDRRKRPESNKENVVPSSASFGAPSSAASFEVSSGGQTKITEQSHYQQIKSSVIRSESPVAPPTVLKHETTTTETKTSGAKLLPLCVEAFQDSVLSPISGVSKTKQQEVTEHRTYQQFKSSTVSSDQSQTQFSPLRSETAESQTKSAAEKLLPVCVEAFQDSVLSPISGIKKTKKQEVTEQSNYQQFQSKMVNSDQSEKQFSSVRSESPGTQSKSAAEKLLPVCVEAFQDSVLSPISGIKKTKKQEVTEQSNYQQFQSSMVSSDQSQTQFGPLRAETQTRSAAEKLLPVCVEAFQDSVLSPISGIKKTKTQEVIENSHYEDNSSNVNRSVTPPISPDSPRIWMSVKETRSSAAEKLLPMCVEAFQDSVLSPISGISKTKHQEVIEHSYQQQKESSARSVSPAVYRSSPKPWSPTTQSPVIRKVLPLCVEAFQDSIQSPVSGISKTKRKEVLEQSNYQSSTTSVSSLVRCLSPKPWTAPDTETKTSATESSEILDTSQSNVIRPVTPPVRSSTSSRPTFERQETASAAEKLLPLCVEAFQDSVLSPISGHKSRKDQEVIEHSQLKQTHLSNEVSAVTTPSVPSNGSRIWMCVSEVRTSPAAKLLPMCVEAFQDSVLSPISGIKKTKKQEVTERSQYEQNISRVKQFWHERTSKADIQSRAKNLLPICVEAFQDSVLSPISGVKSKKNQKVTETSYRQQSQSSMSHSVASSAKPSMPHTQAKSSAHKLLPVCVEAFQDSVLSPISGIKKTKTHEMQSNVVRSVTPPVSTASPKPWKSESNAKTSVAEKLLPVCVEAFQDSVLSPISGISKTKKQEIQSGVTRSPTPPVPNTVPKPWKSELQTGSSAAAKLLPKCVEAFQDSVLSPISGISKTKQQEISSSPIRSVTPPVLSTAPKPWKPEAQATTSSAEKLLPVCVEAFQDSVLSPISGIAKTKKQEPTMPVASKAQESHSAGEKLLPLCVEAFQDSVLSPISGIGKTKKNEVVEPTAAEPPAQPSAGEKLLPMCVEAFQDSVLSPISGIKKTKNQEEEITEPQAAEPRAEPSAGEKLLPLCVEAFQDSVLSPISGIKKTKNQEVVETESQAQPSVGEKLLPLCVEAFQDSVLSPISGIKKTKDQEEDVSQTQPSSGEKLLPLCVEAFQDSVLSPISGIKKTKTNEVTEHEVPETHSKPSPGEALLPLCVEAFQDSVLSPISGIRKTKTEQETASMPNDTEAKSSAERLLPLCVEAFQDSVLSPISGISKTKHTEVTDQSQETKSSAVYSETPSQKPEVTDAQKLIPVCVEAFRDSVLSPISGISKTKTQEISQDGRKTEKTTTETIQETKGSCQTTILRKEKESVVRDSFVTKNRPIFQATPLSVITSQPSTTTTKTTKFESKTSETKQNVWQPTGAVAGKIKEYSSNQPKFSTISIQKSITSSSKIKPRPLSCPDVSTSDFEKMAKEMALAGAANKPVAPASESVSSRNVFQQSEMQSSTLPRRKKQFSSSSFYEDEYSSFPTIEEQVQLCRQIADSLVDESGKKSKGASMFDRRMKRSTSWVHENPEDEDGTSTPDQSEEKEMSDVDTPPRPKSKTPPSLKLILDPRLPQDIAMLKTSGQQISEHNVVSPDICHHLVKDLKSPVGKGGALFAKRKKKAEDWVVDEDKVKEHTKTPEPIPEPPVPPLHKLKEKFQNPKLKLVKSPWEAALQSPIGSVDGAFVDVKPEKLAETVIKAADYKIRSNSQSPISESGSIPHSYPFTPPVSAVYKLTAPRGWTGRGTTDEYDSGTSSGAFTSPEPPLMPSRPFAAAPTSKPTFQNFNTTPKTWNEAKRADASQPSGFKPVRPPTYYTK